MRFIGRLFIFTVGLVLFIIPPAQADSLSISKISVETKGDILPDAVIVISWYTNLPARGRVDFGLTESYGAYIASAESPRLYHEIKLANLKSETTYHYKITADTGAGIKIESFDQTFKTPKYKDTTDPEISDVSVTYSGATYFVVTWRTQKPVAGEVEYSTDETLSRPSLRGGGSDKLVHEVIVSKLKKNTTYYYRVKVRNRDKYEWMSGVQKVSTASDDSADKKALIIDQISPVSAYDFSVGSNSATVSWHTSRPARGTVEYWLDKRGARHTSLNETGFYNMEHSLILTNLTANTRYKFKIKAKDIFGKSVTGSEMLLVTKPATNGVPSTSGGCKGSGIYDGYCRDLAAEVTLAVKLRDFLKNVFTNRVPISAGQNWFTLVKAYVYGGYPLEAIVQAVKFGGKTVHPSIPWSKWQETKDYKNYINR